MNNQTYFVGSIYFLAALTAILLAFFVSRKRGTAGVIPFLILATASAEWSFTYGLEIISSSLTEKFLWAQFEYIGISVIPIGWFLFAQEYSGSESWSNLRRIILLAIVPALTIILVFTNQLHGLIWAEFEFINSGKLSVFHALRYVASGISCLCIRTYCYYGVPSFFS